MIRFLLRRIGQGFLVVLGVTMVVFVATRLVGDPVQVMLPLSSTDQQRADFRHQLGLDKPIPEQFVEFVGDLATLNFGNSLWQRRPALSVVFQHLPLTLELIACGLGLAILLSVPLGAFAALRPGGIVDRLATFVGLLGLSIPQFWLGLMLIVFLAVKLHWLPTSGIGGPSHFVLPAITMALPSLARLMMMVRSSVIDELNQQYIRTARAKGLHFAQVLFGHAMRNALVPFLTLAGWEFINAMAGYTVVVESVFAWPGLGFTALKAIDHNDLYLLQAIVFTVAIIIVIVNIAMDVVYKAIDPRIKLA
jgi:peptide/nickel transport system permease protein